MFVQIGPADKDGLYQSLWGRRRTDSSETVCPRFPSGATPKQCSQSCVQRTPCCCSKTDISPKNSQDYELMLWSESNYTGPQTWPMWYPALPPETTVALIVVEVQHWGLIILSFCVFGSWEGDVAGEGLAQALSEVWEVQKDAVSRGTCRGEAPGIHSQQYRQRYPLIFNVCKGFLFWLHFVKSDSLLILQYFFNTYVIKKYTKAFCFIAPPTVTALCWLLQPTIWLVKYTFTWWES